MVLVLFFKVLCKGVRYIYCGYFVGVNGERLDNIWEEGFQGSVVDVSVEKREVCCGQFEFWDWCFVGLFLCFWVFILRIESVQFDVGGVGWFRFGNGYGFGGYVEVCSVLDGVVCLFKVI